VRGSRLAIPRHGHPTGFFIATHDVA
jgi:hypothetical protein